MEYRDNSACLNFKISHRLSLTTVLYFPEEGYLELQYFQSPVHYAVINLLPAYYSGVEVLIS